MAARTNSSWAPRGPRSRSRPSFRMRFKCANRISIFLRSRRDCSNPSVPGGRFLFGVGNGWNEDEMANHGTAFANRHKLAHERIEAMKAIWTKSKAEYHGE